ncbi:hypothetical protein V7793_03705 [Streptomyces sp. KLMMK]|uniref:hypothetical protein n=1 Tax=Streptomyces sp. KLMMK TaxID=3109353 RepID=UPI003000DDF0
MATGVGYALLFCRGPEEAGALPALLAALWWRQAGAFRRVAVSWVLLEEEVFSPWGLRVYAAGEE